MAAALIETFQKRSIVDVNNEYPTDEDYSRYEQGFNNGYHHGGTNSGFPNPYPKTEQMISSYWGFEEGYKQGNRKYLGHEKERKEIL